jgi:hypothetical protein
MLSLFSGALAERLADTPLPGETTRTLLDQSSDLGNLAIPETLESGLAAQAQSAIDLSNVNMYTKSLAPRKLGGNAMFV